MANVTTNFLPIKGNKHGWRLRQLQMIASVEIAEGACIFKVGNGTHDKVTNATENFAGIMNQPITAADSDFATSKKLKGVWVPVDQDSEAEFTSGAGIFTNDDVGKNVKFNDEISVAVDTAGTQIEIKAFISSTRGRCSFNKVLT